MNQKLVIDDQGNFNWVDARKVVQKLAGPKPVMGEALGCIASQVDEMRAFARSSGFTDIEFVPDRDVDGWFDCKAPSAERFNKFSEACEIPVKNGQFSGKSITKDELESARRLIAQKYPAAVRSRRKGEACS